MTMMNSMLPLVVVLLLATFQALEAFTVGTTSCSAVNFGNKVSLATNKLRTSTSLNYALSDDDDEDDEDEDDFIDTDSLGDWRAFRRNLAFESSPSEDAPEKTKRRKSVSKENEELLMSQNEQLGKEYVSEVWAHETSTPEVGGLVVRLPLEVELYRNHNYSIIGKKLQKILDGEQVEISKWYSRAKDLVEDEMKSIAGMADEEGQIDATRLEDDASEMLSLFLDNQETWQEVCLVLEQEGSNAKTLVINRPMAFKLTEHLGRLVLNGAYTGKEQKTSKALDTFMKAFESECAVYVGGPDNQGDKAVMIHGISDLPGATEISPGCGIYQGGIEAAVKGVLDGKYSPLEFRFFVGCNEYDESSLELAVQLGKYQPVACARSIALKQCISLPKPLWHEVMELCGGELEDLSSLELIKRDDPQFQVVDETDYELEDMSDEYDEDDETRL